MQRTVSITAWALDRGQLERARRAGFRKIELYNKEDGFCKPTMGDYAERMQENLSKAKLGASSIVMPKSGPLAFARNLSRTVELANLMGIKSVVVDYPKLSGDRLKGTGAASAERAAQEVRGLHEFMLSPFEACGILKGERENADRFGIKIFIEAPGGSGITAKPLTFRAWQKLSSACHGFVLDLEHFAQQRIVQPIEEAANPLSRYLKNGVMGAEDRMLLASFDADYRPFMDEGMKRRFTRFLKNPSVMAACDLIGTLRPKELSCRGKQPRLNSIIPSDEVSKFMEAAWASLPVAHVHLTGGHLGSLLRGAVETVFGPSDFEFQHCYHIELDGKTSFLGSSERYRLPFYLHIGLPGRLYDADRGDWAGLLSRMLAGREANINFEIAPNLAAEHRERCESL